VSDPRQFQPFHIGPCLILCLAYAPCFAGQDPEAPISVLSRKFDEISDPGSYELSDVETRGLGTRWDRCWAWRKATIRVPIFAGSRSRPGGLIRPILLNESR